MSICKAKKLLIIWSKYLRNLNPNSAYYNPKSRSMRDNPNPELHPEDSTFIVDIIIRYTGDAHQFAKSQVFAWEAYEKGAGIHPNATPSQAEFLQKEFVERKEKLIQSKQDDITKKCGSQKDLEAPVKELLFAQNEHNVEYSRDGRGSLTVMKREL